jgi:hypothetical protein
MNGGTKVGFSTINLERLQCARRDFAGPTERRRRMIPSGVRHSLSRMFTVASSGECDDDCIVSNVLEWRGDAAVVYYIDEVY